MYEHPIPVVACLIPIVSKRNYSISSADVNISLDLMLADILLVERSIEPFINKFSLPGGYVNKGENFQVAAARKCLEETGIYFDSKKIKLYESKSTIDNLLLTFVTTEKISLENIEEHLKTFSDSKNCDVLSVKVDSLNGDFGGLHKEVSSQFLTELNTSFIKTQSFSWSKNLKELMYSVLIQEGFLVENNDLFFHF